MAKCTPTARRNFLINTALVGLGALSTPIILRGIGKNTQGKDGSLESRLFSDFLSYDSSGIDKSVVESILYDINGREGTLGRAIHIGDGYFWTAYHVVKENQQKMQLKPQARRSFIGGAGFHVLDYDPITDIALLQSDIQSKQGKALVTLYSRDLEINDQVLLFKRLSGRSLRKKYEKDLQGINFYDNRKKLYLGKFVLPENSLLFENQGRILFNNPSTIKVASTDRKVDPKNENFSSLMAYKGDSGSPVFVLLNDGTYAFVGIATTALGIDNWVETPKHPLGYEKMQQTGTYFTHQGPIDRLIMKYKPDLKRASN